MEVPDDRRPAGATVAARAAPARRQRRPTAAGGRPVARRRPLRLGRPGGGPDLAAAIPPTEAERTLAAIAHCRRQLDGGTTLVRDLGATGGEVIALSRAIEAGTVEGPTVIAAGPAVTMTGGHIAYMGRVADGPEQMRAAVRANLALGAGCIKVVATGGVLTKGLDPRVAAYTQPELDALVDEAHRLGLRVAAHAIGEGGVATALRAGVDSVEHGMFLDQTCIELFLETGARYSATFSAPEGIIGGPSVPDWTKDRARPAAEAQAASFQAAVKAGVRVVAGTDAGTPENHHGRVSHEVVAMVEAGLDVLAGVRAVTAEAADLLGDPDRGTLRPGAIADVLAVIRSFRQREVAPKEAAYAQEIQETGTFSELEQEKRALHKRSATEGFYTLFMPESAGGSGVDYLGLVLCVEECLRHGLLMTMPGSVLPSVEGPTPILLDGTPEQQERYLQPTMRAEREACFALTEPDAGSDATRIRTRAERVDGGWVINGRKHFITHGAEADYVILFAVTEPGLGAKGGISCFLVDKDTPGFEVGRRQRTMYDSNQAELVFTDCRVDHSALLGQEGYGFYSAMRWINGGRMSISGMAIGTAQYLYGRMLEYAKVREAFGKKIGANQYVQGMIVDSLAELEQARLLVYAQADALDHGADGRKEAALSKYVATEMVGRIADRAIQVFGGNGYMTEMGIERYARFVRAMRLYEGTSEILKVNIARSIGLG